MNCNNNQVKGRLCCCKDRAINNTVLWSRKKYLKFFIILLFCFAYFSAAVESPISDKKERKGIIEGKVIGKMDLKPLYGIIVELLDTEYVTTTNSKGFYYIRNITPGVYRVRFKVNEIINVVRADIVIKSKRITFLNTKIDTTPRIKEKIDVVAKSYFYESKDISPSTVKFSAEEIRRSPGSAGDISRIVSNLPSVAQISDGSNGLAVRGGSPIENAFYIDNIPIPNINHFPDWGSTGGPISLINSDFISEVNFMPGGFKAMYGDRSSSVMDIVFREGNRKEFDGQIRLSMVDVNLILEAPLFNGKGSFLLSGSKSYLDLVLKENDAVPQYSDLQGKFVLDINERNKIIVLGIGGFDKIETDKEKAINSNAKMFGGFKSNENTVGINWFSIWGNGFYSNTSFSKSYVLYDSKWNEVFDDSLNHNVKSTMESYVLRNVNHFNINRDNQFEFGFEIKKLRNNYNNLIGDYTDITGKYVPEYYNNETYKSNKAALFINYIFKPLNKLTLNLGVRGDYFALNKKYTVSPRFSFNYDLTSTFALHGAWGFFYQSLPLDFVSLRDEIKKFRTPRSDHYVFGFDYFPGSAVKITIDAYLKNYKFMPMSPQQPQLFLIDSGSSSAEDDFVDTGIARSYGFEFTIQKKLKKNFYGLIALSIFKSEYKDYNGKWRNRKYDNRYVLSLVGGYKPNNKWEFSSKWIIAGGIPISPFDLDACRLFNTTIFNMSMVNEDRRPAYHSLNLRIDRKYNFKSTNLSVFLSVWNVYNRKNLSNYYWNTMKKEVDRNDQLPFIPVLGIEFEF